MKTIIVSGGSSGIGEAIVKNLADQTFTNEAHNGHSSVAIFNLDINTPSYSLPNCHFIKCDLTNHDEVVTVVNKIASEHHLDSVVSNAGIHFSADIENTTPTDLQRVFDINVKSAYSLTQASLPFMKDKGGSIIYVASDQALIAKRNSFAYNLSKHALASLAKTTALDYAQYNIRSNAICPGTIETPLYHKAIDAYCAKSGANKHNIHKEEASLQPLNRLGQAKEVAAYVAFLISDDASFITGSLPVIDGGYTTG